MSKTCAICSKELNSGVVVHEERIQNKKRLSIDKKFIYICSPVRGDVERNIEKARTYCKRVLDIGCIPIAPHVMFDGLLHDDIPEERIQALEIGLQLVRMCDELWVFGEKISSGMEAEILLANGLNIPIKYMMEKNDENK